MAEKKNEFVETIKTIFWALIIAGVFRTVFFQPFFIPTGSMKDTLLIGDFVFVNKMAYGYSKYSCPWAMCPFSGRILASEPERGDIIVFKHPVTKTDYVKRLVGLPGDRLQMRDGMLFINDVEAGQVPAGTFEEVFERQGSFGTVPKCANGAVGQGAICEKPRATETLPGGATHNVLNVGDYPGMPDNTGVFTVPEGSYFFMGDNRDNSTDSRFPQSAGGVGFVPAELLLGRVDRVIFSAAGKRLIYFWTWRGDRFFKKVE
ncbi:MAG: signal peptidase I [Rhodobacterales bacterium]|nr:MAG: signal peptidase I [Rhodobacterales bacterium]